MIPNPNWPENVVINEECWTDIDYCKQKGVSALHALNLYSGLKTNDLKLVLIVHVHFSPINLKLVVS